MTAFVDLTEENEHSLRPYAELTAEAGATEYRRLPVSDQGCPTRDEMRTILDAIDNAVARGKNVYVHCWGGIGRTGTAVGCYLVRHGMAAPDALVAIARWREGTPDGHRRSPENDAQENFILTWPEPA